MADMTHPYTDLKEAAMRAIAAYTFYKTSNTTRNELAWLNAESELRSLATRARILSLIEGEERMREALETVCSAVESSGTLTDRWSRTLNAVISARAALKEKP